MNKEFHKWFTRHILDSKIGIRDIYFPTISLFATTLKECFTCDVHEIKFDKDNHTIITSMNLCGNMIKVAFTARPSTNSKLDGFVIENAEIID